VRRNHPAYGRALAWNATIIAAGIWLVEFAILTGFSLVGQYPHPLEGAARRLATAVVGIALFRTISVMLDGASRWTARSRLWLVILLVATGSISWSVLAFVILHLPVGSDAVTARAVNIPRELALNATHVHGQFGAWVSLWLALGYRRTLAQAHLLRAVAVADHSDFPRRTDEVETSSHLWVPTRDGEARLRLDIVDYFEADHDYVRVHTRSGRYLIHRTLQTLDRELSGKNFIRVHRSFMVNLTQVTQLRRRGRGLFELALGSGASIPIGRTYSSAVRKTLKSLLANAMRR
jgi:hypothetical protein